MMQRRTRRGIITLALLASFSWFLLKGSSEPEGRPVDRLDTRLNYALYDFNGRLLDEQGAINFEFQAPVLRSDAQSGVGTIERPKLRIQQEEEQWYITAESAIITSDQEHVSLTGDVFLTRENQLTGDVVEITTEDVLLNVTPRTASSDAEVRITHFNDWLDATGVRIDMIANRFELLKDVRVHYENP